MSDYTLWKSYKTSDIHFFSLLGGNDKGPGRNFGKKKTRGGGVYDKKPRNSLGIGTGKKGRSAEKNMKRGSLRRRDRSAEKAARLEAAIERKTVSLQE